jgi:hypothetical protein
MSTTTAPASDLYYRLFRLELASDGLPQVAAHPEAPGSIPDPASGRPLRVATIEARTKAICPACAALGRGGYVSFESDLRLAYACPACQRLVWLAGA